jgi:hypothetical protein
MAEYLDGPVNPLCRGGNEKGRRVAGRELGLLMVRLQFDTLAKSLCGSMRVFKPF